MLFGYYICAYITWSLIYAEIADTSDMKFYSMAVDGQKWKHHKFTADLQNQTFWHTISTLVKHDWKAHQPSTKRDYSPSSIHRGQDVLAMSGGHGIHRCPEEFPERKWHPACSGTLVRLGAQCQLLCIIVCLLEPIRTFKGFLQISCSNPLLVWHKIRQGHFWI